MRAYVVAARESLADWMTDLGLVWSALSLFAFVVAFFVLPASTVFAKVLTFYAQIKALVYGPIEQLFAISIPPYARDFLLFWAISGAVGARATLWLHRRFFQGCDEALRKSSTPEARRRLEAKYGKADLEREIEWIKSQRDQFKGSLARKVRLYVGCILTGPLFFLRIWQLNPPTPNRDIGGRHMVVVLVGTLLMAFAALFALNWATL